MKLSLKQFFLGERVMLCVIVLNAIVLCMQLSGVDWSWLLWVDELCTILFLVEMIVKHREYGLRGYWSDGWNVMDGVLVLCSLPSLLMPFVDAAGYGTNVLLTLRLLRVVKFFRLLHFFPDFGKIMKGFRLALQQSAAVLASYMLIIFIFGLINCALFRDMVPQYFATPGESIYAVFRLFTVEGWYDIPDAIARVSSPFMAHVVRIYFCILLGLGGIIGMSFINSIFVDALAEDNNDDVKDQLRAMDAKLDEIARKLNSKAEK